MYKGVIIYIRSNTIFEGFISLDLVLDLGTLILVVAAFLYIVN